MRNIVISQNRGGNTLMSPLGGDGGTADLAVAQFFTPQSNPTQD